MSEPNFLVSREFHFDAAHHLPNYNGKCEVEHGHRWQLRVTVKAPLDRHTGMAMDFHEIDMVVRDTVLESLDHTNLNRLLDNPSAENLCLWCWDRLADRLPLHQVEIWETPRSKVVYRPGI